MIRYLLILLFIGQSFTLALSGCDLLDGKIDIEYKLTGSASLVDVTYTNKNGGTSQESNVSVPWAKSFSINCEEFLYISAQNQGSSGSVTTRINVDGEKFKQGSGNIVYDGLHGSDSNPNNHNGTIYGAEWSDDVPSGW